MDEIREKTLEEDLEAGRLARIYVALGEHDRAIETLPDLLTDEAERKLAVDVVTYIAGPIDEMAPHTLTLVETFRKMLGVEGAPQDVTEDPLADETSGPRLGTGLGTAAE